MTVNGWAFPQVVLRASIFVSTVWASAIGVANLSKVSIIPLGSGCGVPKNILLFMPKFVYGVTQNNVINFGELPLVGALHVDSASACSARQIVYGFFEVLPWYGGNVNRRFICLPHGEVCTHLHIIAVELLEQQPHRSMGCEHRVLVGDILHGAMFCGAYEVRFFRGVSS